MSEFESAFLCGLIKKYRPKKILEVGVCSGASTAIMLQCLEDIGQKYEMYSIDISAEYPRDNSLETGFVAKKALESVFIPRGMKGTHKFYIGTILPFVIDEIGYDIDFVMLDTAHVLPGEILDFLVVLPYLKSDAVVVLHDISENLRVFDDIHEHQHATGILFSAVVADKLLNFTNDNPKFIKYPNIAAFQINDYTMKFIENVFLSLIPRWRYIPEDKDLNAYMKKIAESYSPKLFNILVEIANYNIAYVLNELKKRGKNRNDFLI